MSTTETAHKHSFPCNPPGGTYLRPGPCECGKTHDQARADEALQRAVSLLLAVYGDAAPVSTHWAVRYGNGRYVELYDDEEDAREHVEFYEGGSVVRRTVISLPWETVSDEDAEAPAS